MKLEVGKYYRSSNGRKVGPMRCRNGVYDVDQFKHPLPHPLGKSLWWEDGFGDEGEHLVAEWKEETTVDNSIKMDGKYAYRKDPFTQVRILCVDRPNYPKKPVLSVDSKGWVFPHRLDRRVDFGEDDFGKGDEDLVPLQEKLPDLWGVLYPGGNLYTTKDKEKAEDWLKTSTLAVRIIHYIPAPDQTS